jgi:aldose 1-epimerase
LKIIKELFGNIGNDEVSLFTLTNSNGMEVKITNYGGIVTSIITPDKNGKYDDVVLGFDKLEDYINNPSPYFGAIIGRCANRMAQARFFIENKEYKLAQNAGTNHLHGGNKGFDKAIWKADEMIDKNGINLILSHLSPDMDEGYPGNLNVKITYTLTEENELSIEYAATTDKPTPVNLTQHSYFNLSGERDNTILDHLLWIDADYFTPTDKEFIPTGKLQNLAGSPLDFRKQKVVGKDIGLMKDGYDHNFALNNKDNFTKVAGLFEPKSGRRLEVFTTEPGLQLYTANAFDGKMKGKGRQVYRKFAGLCLEAQHFPDSPNQPRFPGIILTPGKEHHQKTVYKFTVS